MTKAADRVYRYLGQRDHSERELRTKLQRCGHSSDEIEAALTWAAESGLLADEEDLATRTAEVLHRKNKGQFYIQRYLQQKGLPEVFFDPELEFSKAMDILRRNPVTLEKAARLLQNRGFSSETIRRVLNEKY